LCRAVSTSLDEAFASAAGSLVQAIAIERTLGRTLGDTGAFLRLWRDEVTIGHRDELRDADEICCLLVETFQEDEASKSLETTHKSAYMYEIPNVGISNMPKGLGLLLKSRTMYETRDLSTIHGRAYSFNSTNMGDLSTMYERSTNKTEHTDK
jgi:hypothetical protein